MRFSIITPSYNDAKTIVETMDSVLNQSFTDYEHIIVDDGSTDDTKKVVESFKQSHDNNHIHYIHQKNADQLNAILTGLKKATGDYIFILHSDDLLPDNDSLLRADTAISEAPSYDAYMGDLQKIDASGKVIGIQEVDNFEKESSSNKIARTALFLGRNLYCDVAFFKASVFKEKVKNQYLTWNTPFWLNFNSLSTLNVKKLSFPILKYRVNIDNYNTTQKGQLNVINGELRTATNLLTKINIPFYDLQFFLYRIFRKANLSNHYHVFYTKKPQKNIGKIISFIVKKSFGEGNTNDVFLTAVESFYTTNSNRCIRFEIPTNYVPFYGKDVSLFNSRNLSNKLDKTTLSFLSEIKKGFKTIIVKTEEEKKKLEVLATFFCIINSISIEVKHD